MSAIPPDVSERFSRRGYDKVGAAIQAVSESWRLALVLRGGRCYIIPDNI